MSDFDQNTNEENTQNNQNHTEEPHSSVYSYSYSDINQGENDANTGDTGYQQGTAQNSSAYQQGTYQENNAYGQNSNPYGYNPYGSSKKKHRAWSHGQRMHHASGNGKVRSFFAKGHFGNKLLKVVAIALVFGLVAGGTFSGVTYAISKKTGKDLTTAAVTKTLTTSDGLGGTAVSTATTVSDVSDIANNVMPAIVAVTNVSYTEYRSMFGQTRTYESESAGSGIIVSQDDDYLYIATNNHVVSGAESLTITFNDGSAVPATVKGTDASVDLAVVAVSRSDVEDSTMEKIKVATLGDSDQAKVGESAVVIGNALGYGQSVTTGVISALSREVQLEDESGNTVTSTLMQTDAAVNPGNSGGALLNMKGEVIGIVSAKYSDTKVEGMGYAIPMSTAKDIIETIINQEVVSNDEASYLGIAGVDVASDVSKQYDMPSGVYITRVASNSAASKAGIKKGDIIVSFNGKKVSSMDEIYNAMQYLKAGTKVEIVLAQASNNYEEKTVEVTLTKKN